jgi:LmbE family N-acetylglucosaminyl deacetylase
MTKPVFLFISPHLDDVALSCGGGICGMVNAGQRVVVATVFTLDAPDGWPISWLARRNQRAWDIPKEPFAVRCEEDLKALRKLGAEALHLGFLDVIYRVGTDGMPLYQKTVVGIPVHDFDWKMYLPGLQAKFRSLAEQFVGSPLYVLSPLALGGHVDHILVRHAIESVWAQKQILYYEDFPYAGRSGVMQTWLAAEGADKSWQPVEVLLTEKQIADRVASVACYTSQLRGLFPSALERILEIARARSSFLANLRLPLNLKASTQRMEAYLRTYINRVGCERYWLRRQPESEAVPFFDV